MLPQKRIDANLSKKLKFSLRLVGGSNPQPYLRVPLIHLALNSRPEMRNDATGLVFKQHLLEFPSKKCEEVRKSEICCVVVWTKCARLAFCDACASGLETTCVVLSA